MVFGANKYSKNSLSLSFLCFRCGESSMASGAIPSSGISWIKVAKQCVESNLTDWSGSLILPSNGTMSNTTYGTIWNWSLLTMQAMASAEPSRLMAFSIVARRGITRSITKVSTSVLSSSAKVDMHRAAKDLIAFKGCFSRMQSFGSNWNKFLCSLGFKLGAATSTSCKEVKMLFVSSWSKSFLEISSIQSSSTFWRWLYMISYIMGICSGRDSAK